MQLFQHIFRLCKTVNLSINDETVLPPSNLSINDELSSLDPSNLSINDELSSLPLPPPPNFFFWVSPLNKL